MEKLYRELQVGGGNYPGEYYLDGCYCNWEHQVCVRNYIRDNQIGGEIYTGEYRVGGRNYKGVGRWRELYWEVPGTWRELHWNWEHRVDGRNDILEYQVGGGTYT